MGTINMKGEKERKRNVTNEPVRWNMCSSILLYSVSLLLALKETMKTYETLWAEKWMPIHLS
jgi:hypothetical protein